MMGEKKLIVIVGPTAVGKTGLAIHLAQHFGTEIVSADSRQVYRELNVGAAKPSPVELALVPHHFIGHIPVTEDYDAGRFSREAAQVMDSIFAKHDYAILCGGSGLYIKALLEGFDELPEVPAEVRSLVIDEYSERGLSWLQSEVAEHDPDYFGEVDKQNPQRLMRALEVIRSTGKTFSGFRKGKTEYELPYHMVKIGLELDRKLLYERIDARMDAMIQNGLFEEAKNLLPFRDLNALQTVGYQEIFGFLDGTYDREEAVRLLKRNSRRYAKRQMTWLRKDKEINWVAAEDFDVILNLINNS